MGIRVLGLWEDIRSGCFIEAWFIRMGGGAKIAVWKGTLSSSEKPASTEEIREEDLEMCQDMSADTARSLSYHCSRAFGVML